MVDRFDNGTLYSYHVLLKYSFNVYVFSLWSMNWPVCLFVPRVIFYRLSLSFAL